MDNEDRDHFRTIASPLAPLLDDLRKPHSAANSHSAPDPAYCLTLTRILFSSYRKDEAHDPEIYCAAIGATLGDFPRQVVEYVTDPRTGLPSTSKFLPNVAEVREACVREAKRLQQGLQPRIKFTRYVLPDKPPGDLFVGCDRPRYSEMSELLDKQHELGRRERGGIWIPRHWYEKRVGGSTEEERIAARRQHFERECRDEGLDTARGVSPSLIENHGRA